MHQENGASVEEILESIKKVIARDNRENAMQMRRKREVDGLSDTSDTDVDFCRKNVENGAILELESTEIVESETIDTRKTGQSDSFSTHNGQFSSADPASNPGDDPTQDALVSDAVGKSMQENLAALAMMSEPGTPPQVVRSGETSLEGLVREMLRPMLAEWLDKNLPEIVENMVRAEINRIAGKKG